MALTLPQAKVLGRLYALGRTETAQNLATLTGLADSTTYTALRELKVRDLVSSGTTMPTYWQITSSGRAIIGNPVYREYRDHPRHAKPKA